MPDAVTLGLLGLVVLLLVVLLILVARRRDTGPDEERLADKMTISLKASGLYQELEHVNVHAQEMQRAVRSLDNLFRLPTERGAAGEFQLEAILGDLLPADRYDIRTNVPGVGTPDARIRSRAGDLYIDAKFPLDAYRQVAEAPDASEAQSARKRFVKAVRGHIESVASKYVKTGGALPFAIMFVPSEAVFASTLDMDPDLVREASRDGVLLASPTTLAAHLSILAAGIQAERLSERAQTIQEGLGALDKRFSSLRSDWETLTRHVNNAQANLSKVDGSMADLERAWKTVVEGAAGE